ncbi:hypothetical protein [Ahrensia sp. R2A130]|uniref:hypothetical protein n=1 Tax=Ahrensia sp. R2A130 TaxID=744979 RepID=UPI0012EAC7BD|nr:hypothetical protein [Ahrensia sp. R2A130]
MKDNGAIYMNGRGVMAKTEKLNSAAWGHVGYAIIGSCGALLSIPLFLVNLYKSVENGFTSLGAIYMACALVIFFSGIVMTRPHSKAISELRVHRMAMEAETKKRGLGWASS